MFDTTLFDSPRPACFRVLATISRDRNRFMDELHAL